MASEQQHRAVELHPTSETRHGVEVFWQIPEHPKAILFIAHSGRGGPSSYWDVEGHEDRPHHGRGRPHHKALITQYALDKGYAVITINSVEHRWSYSESSPDIANVEKILNEWKGEHAELKDLHLSVLGSASGGAFVSALALKVKIFAAVLLVSHGSEEAIKAASKGSYPPTLFAHLLKDENTNSKVKKEIEILKSKGIPTAELVADPVPITPTFFSDNIEGLDQEISRKLHEAFLSNNVIDEAGFIMKTVDRPKAHHLLHSLNILPEDDSQQGRGHRGRGGHGHRGRGAHGQRPAGEEGEATEAPEHRRFGPGRGHRGALAEGEEGRQRFGGPGRRRRAGACAEGEGKEGGAVEEHADTEEAEVHGLLEEGAEVEAEGEVEAQAGAEVGPGTGRGRHHGVGRGRGRGRGHGHGFGRRGPTLKWEREIKLQLAVAEGLHGLTTKKTPEIFSWLDGSTWSTKAGV